MTSPGVSSAAAIDTGPPESDASRRAGASWPDSSRSSSSSARSRCTADSTALPIITEPTRTASTGEPRTALAAAPVARIGVSGSANSVRAAFASRNAQRAGELVSRNPELTEANTTSHIAGGGGWWTRACTPASARATTVSATDRAWKSMTGCGSGSRRCAIRSAAIRPWNRPNPAATTTGPGPRPRTPGSINNDPSREAPPANSTARRLVARAAGTALITRQAAPRSGTSKSAVQAGTPVPRVRATPRSAAANAWGASTARTPTVRPAVWSAFTAANKVSSTDDSGAWRRSKPLRIEPSSSVSTDTSSRPPARAADKIAPASGSATAVTSTRAESARSRSSFTGDNARGECHPTPSRPLSTSARAAAQNSRRELPSAPWTSPTVNVSVSNARVSTTSASTRSKRLSEPESRTSTPWSSHRC